MQRDLAMGLMRRAVTVAETQWPEMADANMEVPLDYFTNEEVAAKERALYETSPLALCAATEVANPHDYLVRNAVGRSVLITRDEDGIAHAFLNYCRHRGAAADPGLVIRRDLLKIRGVKSSILARNVLRIGDVFAL